MDVVFHLPLGVYLFFPDSTASAVFTSLRLMIKLLLKTVYTSSSSSSRGPLSVDTCGGEEREAGVSRKGRAGLFLGSVIPDGGKGGTERSHGQEVS